MGRSWWGAIGVYSNVSGTPTGLSDVVIAGNVGQNLPFTYDDGSGGGDGEVCDCDGNVLDECGVCNGDGPEENFDCNGNCVVDVDCAGVCGGSSVEDECGICDGPGAVYECGCIDIDEGACDCDGNVLDECGVCNGDGPEENFDCDGNCTIDLDCNGECGGLAVIDECGVCVSLRVC